MVWPYLFPAYSLLPLATGLQVEVKVPDWYQLIRTAVVVTAQVKDLVSPCHNGRVMLYRWLLINHIATCTGGTAPIRDI